jgi:hypothetical protein
MDEELAEWMYEAGCRYIQMGIQTMDEEFKYNIIKRYEKSDHVQKALDVMRKYKLRVKSDHMFGLPGEPAGAQEIARKLFVDHPPHRIQTFWTNFLPGTEMVHQALEMGLITNADVERLNEGLDFDFFRTTNNIQDAKKTRSFKAYETIFKLIPLLPSSLRKKLDPKFFQRIPTPILELITFTVDTFFGLIMRNPTHTAYAKHNLYQMWRFFIEKIGFKGPRATRPHDGEPVSFHIPVTKPQSASMEEAPAGAIS